ncbi:uncharacterized protein [Miscanthus floridulus]|uniref:uncharacterized protein n=1 Tax=Miscanthus floridulus TaxID=154761 RepID=UPI00345A720E
MMSGGGYSALDDPKVSGSVPLATGTDPSAIRFANSNLQTFPPSEARGKIAGAYRPPTDADATFSSKGGGAGSGGRGGSAGSDDAAQGGWFRMFSVAAYKPYFDVDTSDVVERIWESVFPFHGTFTEKTSENPDLYGPFWTCTTLVQLWCLYGYSLFIFIPASLLSIVPIEIFRWVIAGYK